ncbi:MAG: T9SS type A sorting domain-containing protein [Candidatus Eisenbacteria bacterium]
MHGSSGTVPTEIAPDGNGGAVVVWEDTRSSATELDLYAQRIDSSGRTLWTDEGALVVSEIDDQKSAVAMVDGSGVLVAWVDDRPIGLDGPPSGSDVYAQRLDLENGEWGHPEPVLASVSDNPADQGGFVVVNWLPSGRDARPDREVSHYSVWRARDGLGRDGFARGALGGDTKDTSWVGLESIDPGFAGSALRPSAAEDYYWEFVGTQDARYATGYSMLVATRQDSVSVDTGVTRFQVVAHTADAFTFWESESMEGYSVDNLAPGAPLTLFAQRVDSDIVLSWSPSGEDEPDLREYLIYRSDTPGLDPESAFYLAGSVDSVFVDTGAPAGDLYYIVTGIDVHENEGAPSNEASVSGPSGLPPVDVPIRVGTAYPNPFSGSTTVSLRLAEAGRVTVELLDVHGRRVHAEEAWFAPGEHDLVVTPRRESGVPLAGGVYFLRIQTPTGTHTQKVAIYR